VKGIAEPIRLVEVVPETELPPVPAPPSAKRRVGERRLLLGIALAVALAAGIVAVVWARGDDAEPIVVAPNSVGIIDPATNKVVDTVPVGDSPGPIAAGAGALWVVNLNDRTLTKIDPSAHSAVKSIAVPVPSGRLTPPLLVAAAGRDVWIWACHQTLFRVDPVSIQIVQQLELLRDFGVFSGFTCAVAAEKGSVWVPLGYPRAEVVHVEAAGDAPAAVAERFPARLGSRSAMAIGLGSIWLAAGKGPVQRLDPATGDITGTVQLGSGPKAIAVGHDATWVVNEDEGSITRIDPRTNSVVRSISVGADPVGLAVSPDAIWVANSGDGTVSRIDPETNTVTKTITVGHRPLGVAVADGLVWVTVRS
jgi:YVTN family beta-propeller protein